MPDLKPIFVIACTVGILVAVVMVPLWVFTFRPPPRTQYRIAVMWFLFALSAIMALLFNIDANLEGNGTGVPFAFRVGGPFAGFLVALFLILYYFDAPPDTVSGNPPVCQQLATAIEEVETAAGWANYADFKCSLNGFQEITAKEEEYFVRNLLGAGYAPSPGVEVESATITTAFVYLSDDKAKASVVKLQRVCGKTSARPAHVRFRSFSSYGTRGLKSVILISEGVNPIQIRGADADADGSGREQDARARITTVEFDYLILTKYPEYPDHDDYLLVDASRFCEEGKPTDMSFAVASTHKPLRLPSAWRMRKPQMTVAGKMPLRFQRVTAQPRQGWDGVLTALAPWVAYLDAALDGTAPALAAAVAPVVKDIRDAVIDAVAEKSIPVGQPRPATLAGALGQLPGAMAYSLGASGVADTLLVLFTWS